MRTFDLVRTTDVSGVSGTGVIAEGVEFTDGTVALRWRPTQDAGSQSTSTAVWSSVDDMISVHGHGGLTSIMWHHKLETDTGCACGEQFDTAGAALGHVVRETI